MILTTSILLDRYKEFCDPYGKIRRLIKNKDLFLLSKGLYTDSWLPVYLYFLYACNKRGMSWLLNDLYFFVVKVFKIRLIGYRYICPFTGGAGSPKVMAVQVVLLMFLRQLREALLEFHRRGKEASMVILDIN